MTPKANQISHRIISSYNNNNSFKTQNNNFQFISYNL